MRIRSNRRRTATAPSKTRITTASSPATIRTLSILAPIATLTSTPTRAHGGIAQGGAHVGAFTDNTSTAGDLGGNTDTAGNLGGNTDTQQPGVGVNANYANINNNATDNVGSRRGPSTFAALYRDQLYH